MSKDGIKEVPKEDNYMTIMPLGGGQEVGRSCIMLKYRGRTIMLDCGTHPGREGNDSLPFFDSIDDISKIDLILVTHFHIDHCAALPYFTEKANFSGKILMTHATKAVMRLLLSDNIRLQSKARALYSEQDLQACIDKIDVMDFHQTVLHRGIRVTASAAGHVLGAAMFTIEIDGARVLYTGDYSTEQDRHLIPGSVPTGRPPDVLIVESTFGTQNLKPRLEREAEFTRTVHEVVSGGGCCLLPVFALGRAQELLLILDEYWRAHPELQQVPVYYASRLANKALGVFQTFVNTMSEHVRAATDAGNPFRLTHVESLASMDNFVAGGPCVVMAAPGFLQTGVSRELFEAWCEDPRHAVVIAGYTVEGTLAHELLSEPREVTCLDGRIKQRRCRIEHISFAAHVGAQENRDFIKAVCPDNIVLVHGERSGMLRLRDDLQRDIRKWDVPSGHRPQVAAPENGTTVKLLFERPVEAEVVGAAASSLLTLLEHSRNTYSGSGATDPAAEVCLPSGSLLVTEDFSSRVLLPTDLAQHAPLRTGRLQQRVTVPLPAGFGLQALPLAMLKSCLEEVFDEVRVSNEHSTVSGVASVAQYLTVHGTVEVRPAEHVSTTPSAAFVAPTGVLVCWAAGPASDIVADAVVGVISQALSVPALLRLSLNIAKNTTGVVNLSSTSTLFEGKVGRKRRAAATREIHPLDKAVRQDGSSQSIGIEP